MKNHEKLALDFKSLSGAEKEKIIETFAREMHISDGNYFNLREGAFRELVKTLLASGRYDDYLKFDRGQREIVIQFFIDEDTSIETLFVLNDFMNRFSHDVKNRILEFLTD